MALAQSRLTAQGRISVPAEVRKRLGGGPGGILEWDEVDGQVIVRRAERYSSADIHRTLFRKPPKPKLLDELKEGVRRNVKTRRARG
jgi:AbrB family looped-hinge helix DNA binding protein